MEKRMKLLGEVLAEPDAPARGELITGRAEAIARNPLLQGAFELVTARSFGPPAVTAECAARFLKIGGVLIVSEPPNDDEVGRWNGEILGKLGLEPRGRVRHGAAFQVLVKTGPTSEQFPRGIGIPGKSPLF
jgi:16S rRNA (guanine527-N7)-methyltransferase